MALGPEGGMFQLPALAQPIGDPLKQAFEPITTAIAKAQAAPGAVNMLETLQNAFTHPQLPQLRDMLGQIPGVDAARTQFLQGMSPPASQLLSHVYRNNSGGRRLGDFYNETGFPGMFNGSVRWPPDLASRIFQPPQTEMFRGLYDQIRGGLNA